MTKQTAINYEEAIKAASYMEVSRRVAEKQGNAEAAAEREQRIHGMAEIISTIYGTWEDDSYGKAYNDIIKAANEYMGI